MLLQYTNYASFHFIKQFMTFGNKELRGNFYSVILLLYDLCIGFNGKLS